MSELLFNIIVAVAASCFVIVGLLYAYLELKPKFERKPIPKSWGELPVVKITGDDRARHVESRRAVVDNERRVEVRLYVDGDVIESRRFPNAREAVMFHDQLVKRNAINPEIGAAPEWHPIKPDAIMPKQPELESGDIHY